MEVSTSSHLVEDIGFPTKQSYSVGHSFHKVNTRRVVFPTGPFYFFVPFSIGIYLCCAPFSLYPFPIFILSIYDSFFLFFALIYCRE
jgi:hypothetical protein